MATATGLSVFAIILLMVIALGGHGGKISMMILAAAVVLLTSRSSSSAYSEAVPAEEYYSEEEYSEEEEPSAKAEPAEDYNEIFSRLPDEFYFSSGVGGWATELKIDSDGYFNGSYHDSEMGMSGDDFDATIYICNFYGQFSVPEKIDDYTYSLRLEWISQDEAEGETWIEDRVQYIGGSPYGLDNAEELILYLPGRTTEDLSEECVSWIFMAEGWSWDERGSTLSGYVLYNVNAGEAFTAR